MNMRKVCITGITGFIGASIARKLIEQGYEVSAVIRESSDIGKYGLDKFHISFGIYDGNINSIADFFKVEKPDVIIHTAALFIAEHKSEQVDELIDSNIKLSMHLFEAMKMSGVRRIINTTSSWEHYSNDEYNPVCLYAATKRAVYDILRYYVEAEEFSAVTLTIYDSYGEWDKRNKVLSLFGKILNKDESLDMSGGEQEINLVYIDDIVESYICSINILMNVDGKFEKTYHVRTDDIYSLKSVADLYASKHNGTMNINWGKRPYRKREVMKVYRDGETVPGWNPINRLDDKIKDM